MNIQLSPYKNKKICVALSGGADSMALLHYINARKNEFGITLFAVHLEHGIRGEKSVADANFVKNYCEKENIFLIIERANCIEYSTQNKMGIEEGARAVRYSIFNDILNSGKADFIFTAHHADDNAETVLFNLFRGSALKGAGGIANLRGKIARPMLSVDKEQILSYVRENDIPFVVDESNFDTKYTRNFIRHQLIPKAKEIFPNLCERIYTFSQSVREDDDFVYSLAQKECKLDCGAITFSDSLEKPIFTRACLIAFKYFGGVKDYVQENFNAVYSLQNLENGSKISLPYSLTAIREYGKIAIYREKECENKEIDFGEGEFEFCNGRLKIVKGKEKGLLIDGDKLPQGAVIRTRKSGDIFQKFGSGTKKLKDFLIDKKIPSRLRNFIPVVAKDNEIYAVCGVEISEKVKIDRNSGNIYSIIYEKE